MKKGKLIVLEGGEGAGKSTQLSRLKLLYKDAVFTREPGGSVYGEKIRNLLLNDEDGKNASPETQLLLFFAARTDHIQKIIKPALDAGKLVISDRFDLSTYAYQLCGHRNMGLVKLFWQIRKQFVEDTIGFGNLHYAYLDIDPSVGVGRALARNTGTNHFDKLGLPFHKRVRSGGYKFIEKINKSPITPINGFAKIIDAAKSPDDVTAEIVSYINTIYR